VKRRIPLVFAVAIIAGAACAQPSDQEHDDRSALADPIPYIDP